MNKLSSLYLVLQGLQTRTIEGSQQTPLDTLTLEEHLKIKNKIIKNKKKLIFEFIIISLRLPYKLLKIYTRNLLFAF